MAVITISGLPGALGDALAEHLHYRLVERTQLVQLVGSDLGWERSPELREHSPSFWERLNAERARYDGVLRRVTTDLAEHAVNVLTTQHPDPD